MIGGRVPKGLAFPESHAAEPFHAADPFHDRRPALASITHGLR